MAHIIFDFDGTLADSLPVLIDEYSRWMPHEKPFSPEDIARIRNMTPAQVIKELKLPIYKIPGMLVRGRDALRYRINEINIFPGIDEVVKQLSREHKLYIMSSNSLVNIQAFLYRYGLDSHFTDIKAGVGIFGKAQQLKLFIKRHNIKKSECYYIGDEVRDIEAAQKAKIKIFSVTWGYNGEQIIKEYSPDFVVSKPSELTKFIQSSTIPR